MSTDENWEITSISELYDQFQPSVFRYLLRMTGSKQIADELTQETFYQAITSVHRFKGNAKVSTWLYKIARNLYLNFLRKKKRDTDLSDKLGREWENVASIAETTPESALEQKIIQTNVETTLQRLPEQYRTILILKEVEQLSHAEIATILGKTTASTKVLLYRAKQKFQKIYREEVNE